LRVVQRRILKSRVNELDDSRAADDRRVFLRRRKDIGVAIRLLDSGGRLLDFDVAWRACLTLNRGRREGHNRGSDSDERVKWLHTEGGYTLVAWVAWVA